MRLLALAALLGSASPAMAQVHGGHAMPDAAPARAATPSAQDHAADAVFGPQVMEDSRQALSGEHGDTDTLIVHVDMLEAQVGQGRDGYLWDVAISYGGDIDKIEVKSAGESQFGQKLASSDNELLWSHAANPWFDIKLGARLDIAQGPERLHAAVGIAGTAPYNIETELMAYVSEKGDVTAHLKLEHDLRITQKLVAWPLVQIDLSAQDIPELGLGSGITHITGGLRLRYELVPEFAPYIGVEWRRATGATARYARVAGDDPEQTVLVAGVRLWF